jgi:hypothetical protein
MDYVEILKRAWKTVWHYKALWIFGVLVALALGGSQGMNVTRQFTSSQFNYGVMDGDPLAEFIAGNFMWLLPIGLFALLLVFIISVALFVVRYVGTTALLKLVDNYAETGQRVRLGEGFRQGWSLEALWLFLLDLILWVPTFIFFMVFFAVWLLGFVALLAGGISGEGGAVFAILIAFWVLGFILVGIFVSYLVSVLVGLFRELIGRSIVLGDQDFFTGLKQGVTLAIQNFWQVLVQALLLLLVRFGAGVGVMIVGLLLMLVALMIGVLPALFGYLLFAALGGQGAALVVSILVFVPLIFTLVSLPSLLLQGVVVAFTSTTWTYTYRALRRSKSAGSAVD